MNSKHFLTTFPIIAFVFIHLCACSGLRKLPFVDHNLPGKLEATEARTGIYDLKYSLEKSTTVYEFRRYAAHHVSHLCLEKGYKYFIVREASPSLREVQGAGQEEGQEERQPGREATGRVQFLSEPPKDKSKAVFDAQDLHDNFKAFDSAGDA